MLGLDSVVTGEALNKALRRAVAALGFRPPPLITVSSAVDLVCNMFTMNSAFREENIPRYVVLFTLTA